MNAHDRRAIQRECHRLEARRISAALIDAVCNEHGLQQVRAADGKTRLYWASPLRTIAVAEVGIQPRRLTVIRADKATDAIETLRALGWS
jgi:hypothetical protein